MSEEDSHRQILRSTSIIGGASAANILIGLVRTKVAAILLGPAGIGFIGLLQNIMSAASVVAAVGLGTAGTRQIAEATAANDDVAVNSARRALFWGTLALSMIGAGVFWILRDVIAQRVIGSATLGGELGWLAFGVLMTVAAASQLALLAGLRRIGDIAYVSVSSAALSTVLGIAALLLWGHRGILGFVLALPFASVLMSYVYVARLPKLRVARPRLSELISQWRSLIQLGSAFMVAGLIAAVGQLVARSMIQHQLGAAALGQFQAAWAISMTYIGFVLTAMGTDYYPRLTAAIQDSDAVNRMVNEQSEIALLLAGPPLLMTLGLAPWMVDILYSNQFAEAIVILRWQVLGDILRVASFPLVYIILASAAGRLYVVIEGVAMTTFLILIWMGLPLFGVKATGAAFLGMYLCYLPIVYCIARRRTGFHWTKRVGVQLAIICMMGVIVHILSSWRNGAAAAGGVVAGIALGAYSISRLIKLGGVGSSIAVLLRRLGSKMGVDSER